MLSVRDTAIWLALVLSLGGPACEKRSRSAERSPVAKDASPGPLPIDDGEPKEPPPPPTVKKSGKGDCKLEYAPRPKRDPNPMCLVKGGTFTMGSGEEDEPKRKMTLPSFYIDQFEVTVAQVVHYLNASPEHNRCPEGPEGLCMDPRPNAQHSPIYRDRKGRYQAFSGSERRPFWTATHYGAERYCRWAGKLLPTEVQWEYAARHDPVSRRDLIYPWGDQFEPRRAACDNADCKDGFSDFPWDTATYLAPVGTFDGTNGFLDGTSPWGVHDMAGNATEWVSDCEARWPTGDCRAYVIKSVSSGRSQTHSADRAWAGPDSPFEGFRCARSAIEK